MPRRPSEKTFLQSSSAFCSRSMVVQICYQAGRICSAVRKKMVRDLSNDSIQLCRSFQHGTQSRNFPVKYLNSWETSAKNPSPHFKYPITNDNCLIFALEKGTIPGRSTLVLLHYLVILSLTLSEAVFARALSALEPVVIFLV